MLCSRGLTNCLPPSRLGIAKQAWPLLSLLHRLASALAAPSVTNPREPNPSFGYLFWGGD